MGTIGLSLSESCRAVSLSTMQETDGLARRRGRVVVICLSREFKEVTPKRVFQAQAEFGNADVGRKRCVKEPD